MKMKEMLEKNLLAFGVAVIMGLVTGVTGNQTALLDHLFSRYHKEVRPICGVDKAVVVKVGIAIRQVIELDEPKQIMTVNVWIRLNWYDCQLIWNASDYGGVDSLILPFDKLWTPDVTLYDNAGDELAGLKDYRPVVYSSGAISYNFPTVISSLCKVDVTYFPFDTQHCPLPFGSWAYHGFQIDLTNRSVAGDMSNFKINSEWELVGIPVVRHVIMYDCCLEPYPDVTFYVTLRRKPLFYLLNLLFPCILITSVAMLGFLLPPDSGEKVSLEITVLLSLAVFLLVVSETLPPSSDNFPFIGIYFCLSMMLVTFSTVLTVIVLNIHFKGQQGRAVPRWVRSIFLGGLARLVCVRHEGLVHPARSNVNMDAFLQDHADIITKSTQNGSGPHSVHKRIDYEGEEPRDVNASTVNVLKDQLSVLKNLERRYLHEHRHDVLEDEWKTVAIILDRLFFIVFFVLSATITLAILLKCIANQ